MQRKAYVTGAAALLTALLAGCSSGTGVGASPDDSKPYDTGASAPSAPPGKYRTLPEACSQVDPDMLETMLPGLKQIEDERQRERAYAGTATPTYETDRRVGCRWTAETPYATDHLTIDFERVVSYDAAVSDDARAEQVFATKRAAAHLPPGSDSPHPSDGGLSTTSGDDGGTPADLCAPSLGGAGGPSRTSAEDGPGDGSGSAGEGPQHEQGVPGSRVLDDLGDAAFLQDSCTAASSASRHRTVTVVFRTSNVIVTIAYEEQPSRSSDVPDGRNMQDTAEDLAHSLVGKLGG